MTHTPQELAKEWQYRYQERLGNLCGAADPTLDQLELAAGEAREAIERLKAQDEESKT